MADIDFAAEPDKFLSPQWLITPVPGQSWSDESGNKRFLLMLTGVVVCDIKGPKNPIGLANRPVTTKETVRIFPDLREPLLYAWQHYQGSPRTNVPGVDPNNFDYRFVSEQYATFGGLNSVYNAHQSVNAAYAVDRFNPIFDEGRVLRGIALDVSVGDSDGFVRKVGYHIHTVGLIRRDPQPPIG